MLIVDGRWCYWCIHRGHFPNSIISPSGGCWIDLAGADFFAHTFIRHIIFQSYLVRNCIPEALSHCNMVRDIKKKGGGEREREGNRRQMFQEEKFRFTRRAGNWSTSKEPQMERERGGKVKDVRGVGSEHDTAKSKNLHREEHMRVSQTRADTQCAARDELGGIQLTAH